MPPLWRDTRPIHLSLELPLDTLATQAQDRPLADVPGHLRPRHAATIAGVAAKVRIRGTTPDVNSLPKLRVELAEKQTTGPLAGIRKLGVALGCASGDLESLRREVACYHVLEAFGATVPKTRTARIDTGSGLQTALVIEDRDATARRFGGQRVKAKDREAYGRLRFSDEDAVRVPLLQALVTNTDFSFDIDASGRPTLAWNVDAIAIEGTPFAIPLMNDFDRSDLVEPRPQAHNGRHAERLRAVLATLKQQRPAALAKVRADVLGRAHAAFAALRAADLSPRDKRAMRAELKQALSVLAEEQSGR